MAVTQVQSVLSADYCLNIRKIREDYKRSTANRFVNVYTKCMMYKNRKSESSEYVKDYVTVSGKSAHCKENVPNLFYTLFGSIPKTTLPLRPIIAGHTCIEIFFGVIVIVDGICILSPNLSQF